MSLARFADRLGRARASPQRRCQALPRAERRRPRRTHGKRRLHAGGDARRHRAPQVTRGAGCDQQPPTHTVPPGEPMASRHADGAKHARASARACTPTHAYPCARSRRRLKSRPTNFPMRRALAHARASTKAPPNTAPTQARPRGGVSHRQPSWAHPSAHRCGLGVAAPAPIGTVPLTRRPRGRRAPRRGPRPARGQRRARGRSPMRNAETARGAGR